MADTAARLALVARRYEVFRFTMAVAGLNLTGVAMNMQVRMQRGTPGAPNIQLGTVATAAAEGLKLDSVSVVDGVPVSIIKGRINQSTMSDAAKVPYVGELGADTLMAYAMQWTLNGDTNTRVEGDFIVRDSAYGSDNAPASRPEGYGNQRLLSGSGGGSLTFGDQIINVSIDGADVVAALNEEAAGFRDASAASAAQADGRAKVVEVAVANLASAYQQISPGPSSMAFPVIDPYGLVAGGLMADGSLLLAAGANGEAPAVTDGYGLIGLSFGGGGGVSPGATIAPVPFYRPEAIRTFRQRAFAARLGDNASVEVVIIADSQWQYAIDTPTAFTLLNRLPLAQGGLGDAGPGWAPFDGLGASSVPTEFNPIASLGAGVIDANNIDGSANLHGVQSSTAGLLALSTWRGSGNIATLDLHYIGGAGTIEYGYAAPGAAVAAFTPLALGGGGGQVVRLAVPPAGQWDLQVRVAGGSASVIVVALVARKAAPGLIVHNLARGTTAAAYWAGGDQAKLAAAIKRVSPAPALFLLGCAGNDEAINRTPAQWLGDLTTQVALCRAINPAADIAVLIRPQTPRGGVPERMASYAAAARGAAANLDVAVLDLQQIFGSSYSEYGYTGTRRQLFRDDNLHLNTDGSRLYVSALNQLLTGRIG